MIAIGSPIYKDRVSGKLVRLTGWGGNKKFYSGYTEDDSPVYYTEQEASERLIKTDLKDWPSLRYTDPKLPYSFDLYWDIKRPSEIFAEWNRNKEECLNHALENYRDNDDFKSMVDAAKGGALLKLKEYIVENL